MAPRKRKAENEWMSSYTGLGVRHDGVFELKHPVTGTRTGLKTKDKSIAIRAWQRFMPEWLSQKAATGADQLVSRLNNMDEVDRRGMQVTLAQYAKDYRLNHLPNSKKSNGSVREPRTIKDYDRIIRCEIEVSPLLRFPIADKYADIKIRSFLDKWSTKNRTYNYNRTLLSIIYERAIEAGVVRVNPVRDIKPKKKPERLVYLDDVAYAAITTKLMIHTYFEKQYDGEWRARICDLGLFSACRPSDIVNIEDSWFDKDGRLSYRASKNKVLMQVEDVTGALAEAVLWLREFKRQQGKISKYLCVYPNYMNMKRREHVAALTISRMFSAAVVEAGYERGQFVFKDIRKKSAADDAGQNKGGHSADMQRYYEQVIERPIRVKNNLVNPRLKR